MIGLRFAVWVFAADQDVVRIFRSGVERVCGRPFELGDVVWPPG